MEGIAGLAGSKNKILTIRDFVGRTKTTEEAPQLLGDCLAAGQGINASPNLVRPPVLCCLLNLRNGHFGKSGLVGGMLVGEGLCGSIYGGL